MGKWKGRDLEKFEIVDGVRKVREWRGGKVRRQLERGQELCGGDYKEDARERRVWAQREREKWRHFSFPS